MPRVCHELVDSSDDEFPDLNSLANRSNPKTCLKTATERAEGQARSPAKVAAKTPLRRRKLGQLADNALLRPWGSDGRLLSDSGGSSLPEDSGSISRPRVQLRARKKKTTVDTEPVQDEDAHLSTEERVPIVEETPIDDSSEFQDSAAFDSSAEDEDTFDDILSEPLARGKPPTEKARSSPTKAKQPRPKPRNRALDTSGDNALRHNLGSLEPGEPNVGSQSPTRRRRNEIAGEDVSSQLLENTRKDDDLSTTLSSLRIDELQPPATRRKGAKTDRPVTPPSTPPKPRAAGLVSPKKMPRIPTTPHHPTTDMFWSQEFVDDWNDEHSPRKQLFPDASKSPSKASPKKRDVAKPVSAREAKKAFEKSKHEIAAKFLQELDSVITQGRLAELAASTGGIQLNWTNKLNTTAGRANWKRETVRTTPADGSEVTVKHRHRASIELAGKVIDDEHRLLNVIAHEFCHLANFMVSGVTGNPHGREFKVWAAKCSRAFADRGIDVTTKHSYDIAFKYVWECTTCAMEFKRHSKSINPERHRCGSCKSELRQTKPVPRDPTRGASEYQKFMKEHMKLLKEENPKSPQKEIMKLVAQKWSRQESKGDAKKACEAVDIVEDVADGLDALTLGGEK